MSEQVDSDSTSTRRLEDQFKNVLSFTRNLDDDQELGRYTDGDDIIEQLLTEFDDMEESMSLNDSMFFEGDIGFDFEQDIVWDDQKPGDEIECLQEQMKSLKDNTQRVDYFLKEIMSLLGQKF